MITVFVGPKGSGKDLGMTQRLMKRKQKGDEILTNYHVEFADGAVDAALLLQIAKNEIPLNHCSLGLSEIHLLIDPRRGSSKRTILISYVLSQVRKRTVRLYCNTQTTAQVEKRLWDLMEYLVFCRRVGEHFFYYKVIDVQNGWKIKTRYILDGRKIYGKYSTEQVITDFDPALLEKIGIEMPARDEEKAEEKLSKKHSRGRAGKGWGRGRAPDLADVVPEE